jgi:hypothetical protein
MIEYDPEPEDVRTAGRLSVRDNLKPKPRGKSAADVWVYTRDQYGRFYLTSASLNDANEMIVWGEA